MIVSGLAEAIIKAGQIEVVKSTVKVTSADGGIVREGNKFEAVGDKIYYQFVVTNKGVQSITALNFRDPLLDLNREVTLDAPLAPGQSYTYMVDKPYEVTQADLDNGSVKNTVYVKVPDKENPDKPEVPGENDTPAHKTSGILLTKESTRVCNAEGVDYPDGKFREAGDLIYYQFVMKNVGNVTIKKVIITDEKLGIHKLELTPDLAPGDVYIYQAPQPYRVTTDDVLRGEVVNTASVVNPEDPQNPGTSTHITTGQTEAIASSTPLLPTVIMPSKPADKKLLAQPVDKPVEQHTPSPDRTLVPVTGEQGIDPLLPLLLSLMAVALILLRRRH